MSDIDNNINLKYSEDINYLKQDKIGKVLIKGLSELYLKKPENPVEYFALWLKNYNNTIENMAKKSEHDKNIYTPIEDNIILENEDKYDKINEEEKYKQQIEEFYKTCDDYFYHEELVNKFICNSIKNISKVSCCYISLYDFPDKPLDKNDDGEYAHLNLEFGKKVLKIVGYDNDNIELLKDKILPENALNTYSLLEESNENKYIFISDVILNNNMYYFRYPRFGSYLGILIDIKTYLNEKSFDDACLKIKEYREEKLKRDEDIKQAKLEMEEKIKEATENEEDIAQIMEQYNSLTFEEVKEPEFESTIARYIISCDNLGESKVLDDNKIEQIKGLSDYFKNSWEKREKNFITADVDGYLKYKETVDSADKLEELEETEKKEIAKNNEVFENLNEELIEYKTNEIKLNIIKRYFEKDFIKEGFNLLKELNFIKYKAIIQLSFYLLKTKKEDVNIINQNNLNWKVIRDKLDKNYFEQLLNFNYKGQYVDTVEDYMKVSDINNKLLKINENEVFEYLFPLGLLLKLLNLITSLRLLDVKIRNITRLKKIEEREQKKIEYVQREERRDIELQEAKQDFNEEDEEFDEEKWLEEWNSKNEEIIIPGEVDEEIDNDVDFDIETIKLDNN